MKSGFRKAKDLIVARRYCFAAQVGNLLLTME